jgi:hypothetical protein
MNETSKDPHRDFEVMRYLDALEAADLETIASMWDEASGDPKLEARFVELESVLVAEESRPPDLSNARHLDPSRRWRRRFALAGALAAACLVALLAWRLLPTVTIDSPRTPGKSANIESVKPAFSDDPFVGRIEGQGGTGNSALTAFAWPLEESQPIRAGGPIPSGLLD